MPKPEEDIHKDPNGNAALTAKEALEADAVLLVALGGPHSGTAVLCSEENMPRLLDVLKRVIERLEADLYLHPPTLQ